MINELANTGAPEGSPATINRIIKKMVPIAKLDLSTAIQTRVRLTPEVVEEYCRLMLDGVEFPAVIGVIDPDEVLRIVDGWHRIEGAKKAGRKEIEIEIRPGDRKDALKVALSANSTHGLARSNADKRHAVQMALSEFADWTDRLVAEICGVGNQLVGDVRKDMESRGQLCESHNTKRQGKDNKSYAAKKRKDRSARNADKGRSTEPALGPLVDILAEVTLLPPGRSTPSTEAPVVEVVANPTPSAQLETSEEIRTEAPVNATSAETVEPHRGFTTKAGKGFFDMIALDLTACATADIDLQRLNPRAQSSCCLAVKVKAADIPRAIKSADKYFSFGRLISLLVAPLTAESGPRCSESVVVLLKGNSAKHAKFESLAMLAMDDSWPQVLLAHFHQALGDGGIGNALFLSNEQFRSQILKTE